MGIRQNPSLRVPRMSRSRAGDLDGTSLRTVPGSHNNAVGEPGLEQRSRYSGQSLRRRGSRSGSTPPEAHADHVDLPHCARLPEGHSGHRGRPADGRNRPVELIRVEEHHVSFTRRSWQLPSRQSRFARALNGRRVNCLPDINGIDTNSLRRRPACPLPAQMTTGSRLPGPSPAIQPVLASRPTSTSLSLPECSFAVGC